MLFWTGQDVIKSLSPLILFCFFIACPAFAQDNPMLYKKIQLSKKSYTFDELTHEIQKQTGITFSYNASKINPHQKFRIKREQKNVTQLLSIIKNRSGIGYKMISPNYIVYIAPVKVNSSSEQKKKAKKRAEDIAKKKETKDNTTPIIVPEAGNQVAANNLQSDSAAQQTEIVIGDSVTVSNYYSSGGAGYGGYGSRNNSNGESIHIVMRYPSEHDQGILDPYASLNSPKEKSHFQLFSFDNLDVSKFFEKNLLITAGVSANETYYFNPGIHFGFRFLYATLSYNFGAFSEWRYGLGMEVPISEKWFLQAELNTGKGFFRNYSYSTIDTIFPPPQDSLAPIQIIHKDNSINVTSKLSSFSLSVATNLNKNILLSGGITINRLKSSYFSEGMPFDINSFKPVIPDATSRFQTLKPPYVLSQSYNSLDAIGVKYWLGIQLSIYWRLN